MRTHPPASQHAATRSDTPVLRPFTSLIIFLNRTCQVHCATCNVAAMPGNSSFLSPDWLHRFFARLTQPPFPFSPYLIWTGGEPFDTFPSLLQGLELAARAGYGSEILTSGLWFRHHPGYIGEIAKIGRPRIRISLDAEHQERVPVSLLVALIQEALQKGLEVNFTLREIPLREEESPQRTLELIRQQLPRFYAGNHTRSRWLHVLPHFPIVASATSLPHPVRSPAPVPCGMVCRDLVIGEDGMVYPCCGFFSLLAEQRPVIGDAQTVVTADFIRFLARHSFSGPCQQCVADWSCAGKREAVGEGAV